MTNVPPDQSTRLGRLLALAGRTVEQRRLVRFLLVGVVNTAFGYGVFALLYIATGQPTLSVVLATGCGILFNFFTTGRLVFRNRTWATLPPFIAAYAIALALNIVLLKLLLAVQMHPLLAQALCLPVVVVASYVINSRFVFTDKSAR